MKKSKIAISLLSLLLLTGCNNGGVGTTTPTPTTPPEVTTTTPGSQTTTPQESTPEPTTPTPSTPGPDSTASDDSSTSSVDSGDKTEALTDAMLSPLQGGYAAEIISQTWYAGSEKPSGYFFDVQANKDNFAFEQHTVKPGTTQERGELINDGRHHYQKDPSEADEEYPMLYDASLSLGNKVLYVPVLGRDPFTYEEVPMTWEEGHYSNVFASLEVDDFVRDGEENRFKLKMNDSSLSEVYLAIGSQLYIEDHNDLESFTLLTDGDAITGFEATFETYDSAGTSITKKSFGTFTDFGEDVTSEVAPLTGTEDPEFAAAIAKLQADNWSFEAVQHSFDFTAEVSKESGHWKGKSDGSSMVYESQDSLGNKNFAYGYYDYSNEEGDFLQGVVPIGDFFYEDSVVYIDASMDDMYPSFDISSLFFVKDEEASVDGKLVYSLNPDLVISRENNILLFTAFDSDSYSDLVVYLTITITDDAITIHNQTTDTPDKDGLVYDITYTDFGKQSNLIPADAIKTDATGLTWSELLSNNQSVLKTLTDLFGQELLDSIPTFGVANVGADVSTPSNPWFICSTYSKEQNDELLASYSKALEDAGFASVPNEEGSVVYRKKVTVRNKEYYLLVTIAPFWNSIQNWGQFQVSFSFASVK